MLLIDSIRRVVRAVVRSLAKGLNWLTRGKLSPNSVTLFGAFMHLPIAYLVAFGYNLWAAVLLMCFGLFDTLDGELARLQGRSSSRGMLLDASVDRLKETMLYSGAAFALASGTQPRLATLAAAACGVSISVSYVKAKGEVAVAEHRSDLPHDVLNNMLKSGWLPFELRIVLLIIGLLANQLALVLVVITILASLTIVQRMIQINRHLVNVTD